MSLGTKHKVSDAKVVTENLQKGWEETMTETNKDYFVEMTRICTYSRLINIELINDAVHDFYYELQKDKTLFRQEVKRNAKRMVNSFIKYAHTIHTRAGYEAIDEIDEIKENFFPVVKDTLQKFRFSIKQDFDNAKYKNTQLLSYAVLAEQLCEMCNRIFEKDVEDFIRKIPKFGKHVDVNALKIDDCVKWLKDVLTAVYNKSKPTGSKDDLTASDNTQKIVNLLIKQLRNSNATVNAVKQFHKNK